MALTTSELWRVRAELGYNLITVDAAVYVSYVAIFETILSRYVSEGASTTCSTAVTASSTPKLVTLTLADATGFHVFDRVALDVDDAQEIATVRSVSGNTISLFLTKAHAAGYPVVVEAGESIIRELLGKIRAVKNEMATTLGEGALKKVDEVEFYQAGNKSLFGILGDQLKYWREELARALGIPSMWALGTAGAQNMSVY